MGQDTPLLAADNERVNYYLEEKQVLGTGMLHERKSENKGNGMGAVPLKSEIEKGGS